MEDPALQIRRFDELPSVEDFSSKIESSNVPAVFHGCVKDWKAFSKWNPFSGGLDYLEEKVGCTVVEAMVSRSAPIFYGDLRSHERVPFPFSAFIHSCKQQYSGVRPQLDSCGTSVANSDEVQSISANANQIYLAQVPILNIENEEKASLGTLKDDILTPAFLEKKQLASINLWMNCARSRSSTHYDPHNNLLCVISGFKQVVLWPPSASSVLYPMPIWGEASNHSCVDLENPDFSVHSRAKNSMNHSQKVILQPGDALFVPEGWFHQVDSDDLTIAINFWWQSHTMTYILEHMDAYYLRRIIRRLVDKEMNQMLYLSSINTQKPVEDAHGKLCEDETDSGGNDQEVGRTFQQLEPLGLQALHKLVSLVHNAIKVGGPIQGEQSTFVKGSEVYPMERSVVVADSFGLEDDPVARTLWSLKPLMLQAVLSSMARNFPRTLEALILHLLTPVGAEVLTRKFDEMDQQTTKDEQNGFYQLFYGVFDDQFAAMNAILNGKEMFAFQALKKVMEQFLGLNIVQPQKPV